MEGSKANMVSKVVSLVKTSRISTECIHSPSDKLFLYFFAVRHILIILLRLDNTKLHSKQGPVVQSVVGLTSLLRVISLTILADSIYNILIFFSEKM